MRIENFLPEFIRHKTDDSLKDKKVQAKAREVLASIPTAGIEPISLGVICAIAGGAITYLGTKLLGKTADEVCDRAGKDLADYLYPSNEANPFSMKACLDSYRFGTVPDIRKNYLRPMPIFNDTVSQTIEVIRSSLKNQALLPFAIISGPLGTGKSTTLEAIARGGDWNYFIFTGEQFRNLLQNEDASNRFFIDIRKEKHPTVFVIDEADFLFKSDDDNTKFALQQFRALTSNKDRKVMFLFAVNNPLEEIQDRAFLNRMNYKITVEMPGYEELKKIVSQQASYLFNSPFLDSFTPDVCEHLARSVFKGKNGRDVQNALMSLDPTSRFMSKIQLQNQIERYFHANQTQ
jgi:hypothetical protein